MQLFHFFSILLVLSSCANNGIDNQITIDGFFSNRELENLTIEELNITNKDEINRNNEIITAYTLWHKKGWTPQKQILFQQENKNSYWQEKYGSRKYNILPIEFQTNEWYRISGFPTKTVFGVGSVKNYIYVFLNKDRVFEKHYFTDHGGPAKKEVVIIAD